MHLGSKRHVESNKYKTLVMRLIETYDFVKCVFCFISVDEKENKHNILVEFSIVLES